MSSGRVVQYFSNLTHRNNEISSQMSSRTDKRAFRTRRYLLLITVSVSRLPDQRSLKYIITSYAQGFPSFPNDSQPSPTSKVLRRLQHFFICILLQRTNFATTTLWRPLAKAVNWKHAADTISTRWFGGPG